MEAVKQLYDLNKRDSERFRHSFIKGMSEILVFGKKPKHLKFNIYSDALNNDISFLQEDLMEAFIKLVNELPRDKKIELKNKLLSFAIDEEWDNFDLEEILHSESS